MRTLARPPGPARPRVGDRDDALGERVPVARGGARPGRVRLAPLPPALRDRVRAVPAPRRHGAAPAGADARRARAARADVRQGRPDARAAAGLRPAPVRGGAALAPRRGAAVPRRRRRANRRARARRAARAPLRRVRSASRSRPRRCRRCTGPFSPTGARSRSRCSGPGSPSRSSATSPCSPSSPAGSSGGARRRSPSGRPPRSRSSPTTPAASSTSGARRGPPSACASTSRGTRASSCPPWTGRGRRRAC